VLATLHSSSCAEALHRICMSFPADIQASIRAQLADCLVGVICQRLDFIESQQLRAPKCEILTNNIAAKGTIRGGQLSQLVNVIQAGGEDGMWSFERYQRWMEQKKDWVRPSPTEARAAADEPESIAFTASAYPAPAAAPAARPAAAKQPAARPAPQAPPAGDGPIEISIDEDLDLEELARQVERRSK
jgi:twitching motility protein PilT